MTKIIDPEDKKSWGPGPWQMEPDRKEWRYKGLPCLALRGPVGAWCGYVGVSEGHALYGIRYSQCALGCAPDEFKENPFANTDTSKMDEHEKKLAESLNNIYANEPKRMREWRKRNPHYSCDYEHKPEGMVKVHGGLTFSDKCGGHICHAPKPGEPDNVWWFGFDCAHAFDHSPKMAATLKMISDKEPGKFDRLMGFRRKEIYWTLGAVQKEVEKLAKQLLKIKRLP